MFFLLRNSIYERFPLAGARISGLLLQDDNNSVKMPLRFLFSRENASSMRLPGFAGRMVSIDYL